MLSLSVFLRLIVNKNGKSQIEGAQGAGKIILHRNCQFIIRTVERKGIKCTRILQNDYYFSSQMSGRFSALSAPGSVWQKSQGIFCNRTQGLNDQQKRHAIIFNVDWE